MAAEANEASTVTPRSETEGPPPKEALSPTPPGLTDLSQKVTQPDLPPSNWHREKPRKSSRALKELGVSVHFLQCGAGVGGGNGVEGARGAGVGVVMQGDLRMDRIETVLNPHSKI